MQLSPVRLKKTFLTSLEKIVGPQGFSVGNIDRISYSRDSNFKSAIQFKYKKIEAFPDVVVWPSSVEDLSVLIKLAAKHQIPVIPFGGGSGVCGGTLPMGGGMIVDMKRMRKLLKLDAANLLVTAETGIMGMHLENELQRKGYTLGHFPSSIVCASLGGYLAARSAGQCSSRYGKIEDMVKNIEVVTGTGEVIQTRDVSNGEGIDLNSVFVGSEGTLGLITKATLRIFPNPPARVFRGIRFENMKTAIEGVRRVMQSGLKPAVIRLYDPLDTFLILSHSDAKKGGVMSLLIKPVLDFLHDGSLKAGLRLPRVLSFARHLLPSKCLLVLVNEGNERLAAEEQKIILKIFEDLNGEDLGEDPARAWFDHRYAVAYKASPLFMAGAFTDTMEVATTWDKIELLYQTIKKAMSDKALVMAHLSHVYTEGGSLYFTFVAPLKGLHASEALYDQIWDKGMKACLKVGGVISHHHGIGRLKTKYMEGEWEKGLHFLEAFKELYDPYKIMNPGKLMPPNRVSEKQEAAA